MARRMFRRARKKLARRISGGIYRNRRNYKRRAYRRRRK